MNNVKHAFLCISSNLVYLTLSKVPFFPFCFIKYPRFWFKIHFLAWNILLYNITSLSNYITKSNKKSRQKPCISSISQEIVYHPLEEWHIIIAKAIQPTVDDIRYGDDIHVKTWWYTIAFAMDKKVVSHRYDFFGGPTGTLNPYLRWGLFYFFVQFAQINRTRSLRGGASRETTRKTRRDSEHILA